MKGHSLSPSVEQLSWQWFFVLLKDTLAGSVSEGRGFCVPGIWLQLTLWDILSIFFYFISDISALLTTQRSNSWTHDLLTQRHDSSLIIVLQHWRSVHVVYLSPAVLCRTRQSHQTNFLLRASNPKTPHLQILTSLTPPTRKKQRWVHSSDKEIPAVQTVGRKTVGVVGGYISIFSS